MRLASADTAENDQFGARRVADRKGRAYPADEAELLPEVPDEFAAGALSL
jgi:hypothetical protein